MTSDSALCCSDEKPSELRRDDHDEFDEAGKQGEAEREPSGERQSIKPESAVQSEVPNQMSDHTHLLYASSSVRISLLRINCADNIVGPVLLELLLRLGPATDLEVCRISRLTKLTVHSTVNKKQSPDT